MNIHVCFCVVCSFLLPPPTETGVPKVLVGAAGVGKKLPIFRFMFCLISKFQNNQQTQT